MKIISLSPSFTEILENIGRAESLSAVSNHCPEIRNEIPRIGSPKALDFAAIANQGPDLILSDPNENRPEEIRELEKKFRVVSFEVRSVQAVMEAVNTIGRLAEGMPGAMKLIDEIQAAKEAAQNAAKEIQPRVRTLMVLWNSPYIALNFDTYVSRLVETCGGHNVFHEDPIREFPVDLEDLIEKNPGLLLLPTDPFPFKKRHVAKFREYRIFSKIRIELVDGKLFSRYGPSTVEALKFLSERIVDTSRKGIPAALAPEAPVSPGFLECAAARRR